MHWCRLSIGDAKWSGSDRYASSSDENEEASFRQSFATDGEERANCVDSAHAASLPLQLKSAVNLLLLSPSKAGVYMYVRALV